MLSSCSHPDKVRNGRCRPCDRAYRLKVLGPCSNGCIDADGQARPVWARKLCSTCYKNDHNQKASYAQSFNGNPDNQDHFVKACLTLIKMLRPHRNDVALYLNTGTGFAKAEKGLVLIHFAEQTLTVAQYNYTMRQVNDGASEAERLPLKREGTHGQAKQEGTPEATAGGRSSAH